MHLIMSKVVLTPEQLNELRTSYYFSNPVRWTERSLAILIELLQDNTPLVRIATIVDSEIEIGARVTPTALTRALHEPGLRKYLLDEFAIDLDRKQNQGTGNRAWKKVENFKLTDGKKKEP